MFNWQADPGKPVVSPRFWVYWAITVPVTVVIFLATLCWVFIQEWLHRYRARIREKREEIERLQGPGPFDTPYSRPVGEVRSHIYRTFREWRKRRNSP